MPTLQIRFVSGKGYDSRLIEWYSRCRWSHVEFLEGEWTFGAQLRGGVRNRHTNDPCYAHAAAYETWQIEVTDEQWAQFGRLKVDAEYTRYDWPAILSFVMGPRRLHLKGAYICSGFVMGVLGSLGLVAVALPIENYTPRDVWMLVPNILGAKRVAQKPS